MKKLQETFGNLFENDTQKTIAFFAFYFVFFAILFLVIFVGGDKNYLNQEYESGNSINNKGVLNKNFLFDYKVNLDGVTHNYYGKKYGDTESFKYNNNDYYRDGDQFFVNQDTWVKTENPYVFYEFLDFDILMNIMGSATFMEKNEFEDGRAEYHYFISSNALNLLLYEENTDYDNVPDSIDITTDSSYNVTKIFYQLDTFCKERESCLEHLSIEMNFEMFGEIKAIDNPTV